MRTGEAHAAWTQSDDGRRSTDVQVNALQPQAWHVLHVVVAVAFDVLGMMG
jgi:hypothetical protein